MARYTTKAASYYRELIISKTDGKTLKLKQPTVL